jgi:hypothetical protein
MALHARALASIRPLVVAKLSRSSDGRGVAANQKIRWRIRLSSGFQSLFWLLLRCKQETLLPTSPVHTENAE